jgi:hypothetical protein
MDCFNKIIEDRIQRAQQEGAFDNLPGKGKPLDFEDDSFIPEDLRPFLQDPQERRVPADRDGAAKGNL